MNRHYLREWRQSRDLPMDTLAELIGISKVQLSRVERGAQPYSRVLLEQIARALCCAPSDLIAGPPPTRRADDALEVNPSITAAIQAGVSAGVYRSAARANPSGAKVWNELAEIHSRQSGALIEAFLQTGKGE